MRGYRGHLSGGRGAIAPAEAGRAWPILVVGLLLAGCGGSGSGDTPRPSGVPLSHLALFPARLVAVVGETITFAVTARDQGGADVPNAVPSYSSSNPGVVRVEPDGRIVAGGVGTATVRASSGGLTAESVVHVGSPTYDLTALGPPRVLNANYIDLSKIERISRFRSTIGHSYVDGSGETCRSMKHYYQPHLSVDWTMVEVRAPASGTIWLIATDGAAGFRIMLRPRDQPALEVALFHVNPDPAIVRGTWVEAGGLIGHHASPFTMSDIAVSIGSKETGTLLSYFDTMTDAVLAEYQARGVPSRVAAIITRAERDADPVPCAGESQFVVHGNLPDWLLLY